jgi:hypothetical protein
VGGDDVWATILLLDDQERFDGLLAWARAHDTLALVVKNPEFAAVLQHAISMDLPPDRDLLAMNGGVVELNLPFVEQG